MPSRNKTFRFSINDRDFQVTAEPEGECRFMVRMSVLDMAGNPVPHQCNIRIGYLTGRERRWVGEFFGNRPAVSAASAKEACRLLAAWASVAPCFTKAD